tara:strand:+ start:2685 stop:3530 length:846 start_codon:yes stop_codon:yes gene_type:complete
MDDTNTLISIATYKESENIVKLITQIRLSYPTIKILIINDNSKDDTQKVIQKLEDKDLIFLERPSKLGLGTAHKLSMFYAIKYHYSYLLTMDGDFSHDPIFIPKLLEKANIDNFVIGSRFIKGGKTDYSGIRKYVSLIGNYVAKKFLKINCNELTTYFRVYSVNILKKLPFNELNSEGYSLGVRIIWLMNRMGVNLIEIPIHFKDRNKGKSKIPKFQIIVSVIDLLIMKFKELYSKKIFYNNDNPTYNFEISCPNCKSKMSTLIRKKKFRCLVCGKKYESN